MSDEFFKPFSRRQAEANGDIPDVYKYDELPDEFCNRVAHVLRDTQRKCFFDSDIYRIMEDNAAKYLGRMELGNSADSLKNIIEFIRKCPDTLPVLDLIEYILRTYDDAVKPNPGFISQPLLDAIDEINFWFKYSGLGYEFQNGQIIRIDTKVIHQEAVKPALFLLSDPRFKKADQEMMEAFEARRQGKNGAAIHSACNAFESIMKSICKEKFYPYDGEKDAAKKLINILKENKFFPPYMDTHMSGILTTLESGLPVVRNKNKGHGPDPDDVPIPDEYTDYALHLAATNIVFLARLLDIKP